MSDLKDLVLSAVFGPLVLVGSVPWWRRILHWLVGSVIFVLLGTGASPVAPDPTRPTTSASSHAVLEPTDESFSVEGEPARGTGPTAEEVSTDLSRGSLRDNWMAP